MTLSPTINVEIDFDANPTASYADTHSVHPDVVSFWRMNSTSTFDDEKGVNDGVLVSTPATIAGPYTNDSDLGLTFDGASDSARVDSSDSISFTGEFTVDGWVRMGSAPGSTVDLVSKPGSWRVQIGTDMKARASVKYDATVTNLTSNTVLATSTWYHVLLTYDGATVSLFINGVLDASAAHSANIEVSGLPMIFAGSISTTAPAYGTGTTNNGISSTPNCAAPASTASGDLLIAHVATHDGTADNLVTYTSDGTGADFTLLEEIGINGGADGTWSQLWYKIATGGEPASYQWESRLGGVLDSMGWVVAITRIASGQFDSSVPFGNTFYSALQSSTTVTHGTGDHIANANNMLRMDFVTSRANGTWTGSSGSERYDAQGNNMSIAMYSQTASFPTVLTVNGTNTISQIGAAHTLFITGTGVTETGCSLDDWALWNVALSANEVALVYETRNGGAGTPTVVSAANVRPFSVTPGNRSLERDQIQAGSLSMVIQDTNRTYDPSNTSGSEYPNVLPMRRVNVEATWNSVTYPLGEMYITEYGQTYIGHATRLDVGIQAVDGFDLLSTARIDGTLDFGLTGAQISRVLDYAQWPQSKRSIDDGQYVLASQTLDGYALGIIQELVESERGSFFIDVDGVATFHDGAHRNTVTSSATFEDGVTGGGIRYQEIAPVFTRDRIINEWVVSPDATLPGGAAQTATDALSQARFGLRSMSRSTRLFSNEDALEQAGMLVAETAWPQKRYEEMVVWPVGRNTTETNAAWAACLDLRVGDLITVIRGTGRGWTGSSTSGEYFVEGKSVEAIDDRPWVFTFKLSPRSSGNYFGYVVLSDPVSYWRMDVNT